MFLPTNKIDEVLDTGEAMVYDLAQAGRYSHSSGSQRFEFHQIMGDTRHGRQSRQSNLAGPILTNTNMVLLILFSLCCGVIALVVGIVGLATCNNPDAKQRAMIITIIAGICSAGAIGSQFAGFFHAFR